MEKQLCLTKQNVCRVMFSICIWVAVSPVRRAGKLLLLFMTEAQGNTFRTKPRPQTEYMLEVKWIRPKIHRPQKNSRTEVCGQNEAYYLEGLFPVEEHNCVDQCP